MQLCAEALCVSHVEYFMKQRDFYSFSFFFPAPQEDLCSPTKIRQKWTLFVPRLPDPPDPNVTTRGSENGRGPRKYHKI